MSIKLLADPFGRLVYSGPRTAATFLSRVAEGQARRRHGNHAPDLGALKCQILPDGPPEGERHTKPVVAALRRAGLGKIRKTLLSLNSFQTSGNSPGPARCRQPNPLDNIVWTDRFDGLDDRPALVPAPRLTQEKDIKKLHQLAEAA